MHALDRTGPPMLALALVRWMRRHRPDDELHVVAFRGGPLEHDLSPFAPVTVLLRPSEPWDHTRPPPERRAAILERTRRLPRMSATLLVSVAGAQVLDLLDAHGPVVTWVVEQGEDLHWLDPPVDLAVRSAHWLAGSCGTRDELADRLAGRLDRAPTIAVAPEFIEPVAPDPTAVAARRAQLRAAMPAVVVGAGIGTHRKGADLFVEAALASQRRRPGAARFCWIGGEHDPLVPRLRDEVDRLGLHDVVGFVDAVPEIDTWLAAADVFLHTARLDAFPLVCLHAASVGTPVVSFSGCGGVEEMLGPTFLGAPYPDVTALTEVLHEVLDRPTGPAEAQRRRVLGSFVADLAAPTVAAALDGVLTEVVQR